MRVRGTVQGVGFRPFVHRHAVELGLVGWVGNDGDGVVLEAEGRPEALDALVAVLYRRPPPLADVEAVEAVAVPCEGGDRFAIRASEVGSGTDARVSADVAPCARCLAEVRDPADRRFQYPFTNCTDCGPRYTIVRSVPYDRPRTTMASFTMCADCLAEYEDPSDRRFHAQPNACARCGPAAHWRSGTVSLAGGAAVDAAAEALRCGAIVAVKGVGGYHLACDATDERAVAELRRRKHRPHKPLAVMVASAEAAAELADLTGAAQEALVSPRRPIVLARQRAGCALAPSVAPGLHEVGVMLPSSLLHQLLLERVARPLVMTSGNRADEPVLHRDDEARTALEPIVDGLLSHDREIHVPVDDSVVRSAGDGVQMVRRARGWTPQPLRLPVPARPPVLAVGAHLKSTVALAHGDSVVLSQHLGDLGDWRTSQAFAAAVQHLTSLSGVRPAVVAHDLHPDYRSTAWATESGLPLVAVQHHHAHVAACLVEHGVTTPVLGIAFDGVGLGTDGALWGGELLVADLTGFSRAGHLVPVALPGGDAAVREPWRVALAWLHQALGPDVAAEHGRRWDDRWPAVLALAASGRSPQTTSVGRLFDAVAALLGVRREVTYEGQAAVELESLARTADPSRTPALELSSTGRVLDPTPALVRLLEEQERGCSAAELAAAFHRALAEGAAALAEQLAAEHTLDTVALSGGVFQNVLLSELLSQRLHDRGLRVLAHRHLPPHDGSISVGQAAIAAASSAGRS